MDKRHVVVIAALFAAFAIGIGCIQTTPPGPLPTSTPAPSSSISPTPAPSEISTPPPLPGSECEGNGGTCTTLGDFAPDSCEQHGWQTLPYGDSCPRMGVNTQCCKKDATVCAEDVRECPGGTFVSRDPANGCQFKPCLQPVACPADAKQCPDGTYVGRVGPKCEFAPCPPTANCTCPQGYVQDGKTCNPTCYYSTPKCLMPSLACNQTA